MTAAMHMHLPDQEKTILPHATMAQTHAEYVLDKEKEFQCEWWRESLMDYQVQSFVQAEDASRARVARYNRRRVEQKCQDEEKHPCQDSDSDEEMPGIRRDEELQDSDVEDMLLDPHELDDEDIRMLLEDHVPQGNEKCRYGNKLLGAKDGGNPEHPEICFRAWFLRVWTAKNSPCKHVQVRKWLPFAK